MYKIVIHPFEPRSRDRAHRRSIVFGLVASKDGDNVIDWDDKQLIVVLQIDGNRILGMKQDLVVLSKRQFLVIFDDGADRHNSAGDRGDLRRIGKRDSAASFTLGFILSDQDTVTDRFDVLKRRCCLFLGHLHSVTNQTITWANSLASQGAFVHPSTVFVCSSLPHFRGRLPDMRLLYREFWPQAQRCWTLGVDRADFQRGMDPPFEFSSHSPKTAFSMRKDVKRSLVMWPLAASVLTLSLGWLGLQRDVIRTTKQAARHTREAMKSLDAQLQQTAPDDLSAIADWDDTSFEIRRPSVLGVPAVDANQTTDRLGFHSQGLFANSEPTNEAEETAVELNRKSEFKLISSGEMPVDVNLDVPSLPLPSTVDISPTQNFIDTRPLSQQQKTSLISSRGNSPSSTSTSPVEHEQSNDLRVPDRQVPDRSVADLARQSEQPSLEIEGRTKRLSLHDNQRDQRTGSQSEPATHNESQPEIRAESRSGDAIANESSRERDLVTAKSAAWPTCDRLLKQLDSLTTLVQQTQFPSAQPMSAGQLVDWTANVRAALLELNQAKRLGAPTVAKTLADLQRLQRTASAEAELMTPSPLTVALLQTAYAIERRLAVWEPIYRINSGSFAAPQHAGDLVPAKRSRLDDGIITTETSAIDYAALLHQIEKTESNAIDLVTADIAHSMQALQHARHRDAQRLALNLDRHYRNANLRFSLSEEFLQNLMPEIPTKTVPVRTTLLGSRVTGISEVDSVLQLRLLPSKSTWELALETTGNVSTRSVGRQGPAAVRTSSVNPYAAVKRVSIQPTDIDLGDSSVTVGGRSRLRGINTSYDSWPLLGALVQNIAESEYRENSPLANRIGRNRIRSQVKQEIDRSIQDKVDEASIQFSQAVLGPLTTLRLDPQVIDMNSMGSRLVARYRMAGDWQLAAMTPRPRAHLGNLMSIQVHQSAINNMLEQLIPQDELLPIEQVLRQCFDTVGATKSELPDELPEETSIEFAKHRPITVEIEDAKVWITMRVLRLDSGNRVRLRNFIVRAAYKPQIDGLSASLVRDGHLSVSGPGMSMRQRFPVRAIFNKVLSPSRALPVTSENLLSQHVPKDAKVTQFELRDGWVGISIATESELASIAKRRQGSSVRH